MTPEGKLYSDVKKLLERLEKELPLWWFKVHGHSCQKRGVPDLSLIVNGHAIYIELKTNGGMVAPLQEHTMYRIRRARGTAVICCSVEQVEAVIRAHIVNVLGGH